jgi:hypothetical protein
MPARHFSGTQLRNQRRRAGLSVHDVAARVGRSCWSVYAYERGQAQPPLSVADALAARGRPVAGAAARRRPGGGLMPGGAFRIAEGYVEVTADQSPYDRSLEKLKTTKHTVKIGVDLDDKDALSRLTALAATRVAKINVNVAGAAALTDLAQKTRDRTVKLTAAVDAAAATSRLTDLAKARAVQEHRRA